MSTIDFDLPAQQDACAVANPPAPCLSHVGEIIATQPDNTALWGIFFVGLAAGFVLAFVLTAPSAYQLGKREGRGRQVLARHAARDARYDDVPGHPEHMR